MTGGGGELHRTAQECNTFLKRQVRDWQSQYQSAAVPIPRFPPSDDASVNFMGRLSRELLRQTHPDRTMYLFPLSGWFDTEGREVVGIRMFSMLKDSVRPPQFSFRFPAPAGDLPNPWTREQPSKPTPWEPPDVPASRL